MCAVQVSQQAVLSISFRPQTFRQIVGQRRLLRLIQQHCTVQRMPLAWMFVGDTGVGKTTFARILALSLQCSHQEEFGNPCKECRRDRLQFDIVEINASEVAGVQEIGQIAVGAYYAPRPPSRYRVYILDEAQRLSDAAQNLLLKYFEDCPRTTVWIVCTTEPRKILRTLRSRCLVYTIPGLGLADVEALVKASFELVRVKKDATPLVEALHEQGVNSPRLVVMAVEKYLAGESAEKAAQVGLEASVNTLRICRAVVHGDWDAVRVELKLATPDDARAIRGAVAGYLRPILLEASAGGQAYRLVESIEQLGKIPWEDGLQVPTVAAALYRICRLFRR